MIFIIINCINFNNRTPLGHLLSQRRDSQLVAVVNRGLVKRCEEILRKVGQDAHMIVCQDDPEKFVPETIIIQRILISAMFFQSFCVFSIISLMALVRLVESRRKLLLFLGCVLPSLLGGLLTGLSLLIFSEHLLIGEEINYSFWMSATSAIVSIIVGVLVAGDTLQCCNVANQYKRSTRHRSLNSLNGRGGGGGGGFDDQMAPNCPVIEHSIRKSNSGQHIDYLNTPTPSRILPTQQQQQTPVSQKKQQQQQQPANEDLPPQVDFNSQTNNNQSKLGFTYVPRI